MNALNKAANKPFPRYVFLHSSRMILLISDIFLLW